ncbi:MAG: phospholipase/Carboxylesterase family protein [Micavibrio sp.]|nr:phospholipase/Carboxylesterase family protein [Micavibrio sp.]
MTSLVVMLHGYGRNATYMQKMADEVRARLPQAMALCVHGPRAMDSDVMTPGLDHHLHVPQEVVAGDDGNPPEMMREWFRIDGDRAALHPRLMEVAENLNAFIDIQRDMFGLTEKQIVLMGFSQGGGTALYTAYTRAQEIGALVCHSSIVIERPGGDHLLQSAPQTLFLYGEKDPEFPQEKYRWSFEWVDRYTGGRAIEKIVPKIGHYTSSESRKICGDFIYEVLAA